MNKDEIIKLARESGVFEVSYPHPGNIAELERFAALVAAAERAQCLKLCEVELSESDYAEAAGAHACVEAIRAALDDHVGGVTNMVTTEPDNLLRRALAQALRNMANGFDELRPWYHRPWSRPDPLIMRTLRRAADALDKEDV